MLMADSEHARTLGESIVFGSNFDTDLMPYAPSLCLSPTEGREDLKPKFSGNSETSPKKSPLPSWERARERGHSHGALPAYNQCRTLLSGE
jgi:hypothetical protein